MMDNNDPTQRQHQTPFLFMIPLVAASLAILGFSGHYQLTQDHLTPQQAPRPILVSSVTPAILHQVLPPNAAKYDAWRKTWQSANLTQKTYYDDDLESIMQALDSPHILQQWSQMRRTIEKVDFVRYALLYIHGGVYADADQELVDIQGLKRMIDWNTVVLPLEQGGPWQANQIGQALMISPPRHPFWMDLMEYIVDNYNASCNVLLNTGPLAVTAFWNTRGRHHRSLVESSSSTIRLSRRLDGRFDTTVFNQSATWHHMGGSWIKNVDEHGAQLRACSDRMPSGCVGCEEMLYL